jgi:hypothetical protein
MGLSAAGVDVMQGGMAVAKINCDYDADNLSLRKIKGCKGSD